MAAAIFVFAALPFARAWNYGVFDCDDYAYVVDRGEVTGGFSARGLKWAFANVDNAIWMPLTWLSYQADFTLAKAWGCKSAEIGADGKASNPAATILHLHSILLHAANAVLLWRLLILAMACGAGKRADESSARALAAAAFAALVWAAHPLRTEPVAWISSRKDVLSAFWLLLALIGWTKWRMTGAKRFYARATAAFAVGALAKPSVMAFPALCVALDAFEFGKTDLGAIWRLFAKSREQKPEERARALRMAAPYALPAAMACAVALEGAWAQGAGGAMREALPLWWRLFNAATSFGLYLWRTAWPDGLAVQCVAKWPGAPRAWEPGCAAAAVFGACAVWAWRRRNDRENARHLLTGAAWFATSVFPTLGIVGFGYHSLADRFTYVPAMGLSLAGGAIAARALARAKSARAAGAFACAALAASSLAAWRQTGFWKDDFTAWGHTLEVDGEDNYAAHMSLCVANWEHGHDLEKSLAHFRAARKLDPENSRTMFLFAVMAHCELGQIVEAEEILRDFAKWNDRSMDEGNGPIGEYLTARAAWLAADRRTLDEAELTLGKLTGVPPNNSHVVYLRSRIAEMRGDERERDEWLKTLKHNSTGDSYARYRWATKGVE